MKKFLIGSSALGILALATLPAVTAAEPVDHERHRTFAFGGADHAQVFERGGPGRMMIAGAFGEDKDLTLDQVRAIVEGHLAMRDLENLKVATVKAVSDDVAEVTIETKDGSLVETRQISRKTGLPLEAEERFKKMRERFSESGGPRGKRMGKMFSARDLDLTNDEVESLAKARLIMRGNERLQVAKVENGKENTAVVTIETLDGSIVDIISIDRDTGRPTNFRKG